MGRMSTTTEPVIDEDATLRRLFETEYTVMVRLACTLVGSNAEAEDLVQDSFVEVARRLDEIRQPGAYLRSRVMELHPPEPPAGLASEASELCDVLGRLPEDQRICVVLRYYGGYRASEIAKITDTPAATVRSHLRRGLTALRKELET